ncbi:MAG TPA: choice-of-anchor V domain-containing protein [Chitinophagales bacterium]
MKKTITLLSFASALAFIFNTSMLQSHIVAPPVGTTGAPPSSATCAQPACHSGSAVEDDMMFAFRLAETDSELINFASIVDDSTHTLYTPGQTYFGSIELGNGATAYGFELLALNGSNAQAGSFTVTDATHTQITSSGGKQYLGHKNANSNKVFNFKWTAPSTPQNVTFYYAGNWANGDSTSSGDEIYNGSVSISSAVSGIKDISSVQNFNVFPTQTMSNISVKLNSTIIQTVGITLVDMSGKVVKTLRNESVSVGENEFLFDISEVPQGAYLLSLQAGNTHTAKHIVKL